MSNTQQIKTHNIQPQQPLKKSALDRFSLGFEYNKTLQDIKREVRQRTI